MFPTFAFYSELCIMYVAYFLKRGDQKLLIYKHHTTYIVWIVIYFTNYASGVTLIKGYLHKKGWKVLHFTSFDNLL